MNTKLKIYKKLKKKLN